MQSHLRLVAALAILALPLTARAEEPFKFENTPGKLPKEVVPASYAIQLKPNVEKLTFTGSEVVVLEVRKPVTSITLNVNTLTIGSARLTGPKDASAQTAQVAINEKEQTATLTFAKKIAAGRHELRLDFAGKINQGGQGLFYADYADGAGSGKKRMLGTQMEPVDARRMFPCWDEPSFRARFRLTAIVPASFTAISNMPVESEKKTSEGKEVRFAETPPMPTYLMVFCAGEFDSIFGETDGVKIGIITTKGKAETGRYALESAQKILRYFNEYFGEKYPLPKLDLMAVPGGFGGAMENWGGITYYESALLFDPTKSSEETRERIFRIVAHEMAHQWFGDLVTMAWWDNLWLNEGFASWMGTKCTDHFNPQWQVWLRANAAKQRAMATDALSSTHPIQQPVKTESEANSAFDEITYQKGQSFLRMLETYLGEEDFRTGIRAYITAHKFSNSTTADLWNALAAASHKPVGEIARSWTEQPGFPLISVTSSDSTVTATQERFTVHQKAAQQFEWKIPIVVAEVKPQTTNHDAVFLLREKSAPIPNVPPTQNVKLNAGGVGNYRVRYEPARFEKLLNSAADLSKADKVNLVSDSWALVLAERGTVPDYFKLVEAFRADPDLALWEEITNTLAFVDALYLKHAERPGFQAYARSVLQPVFERVGWEPKPGEEIATGLLRRELIGKLGDLGDEEIIRIARECFQKFLADPNSLAPDLRAVVFDIVGRYADAKTWDTLHHLGLKTKSIEEKGNFYHAMAMALDPELARKTLALSVGDELPASRATRLVGEVANAAEQPELAWEFAQAHQKELDAKLDALGRVRFASNVMRGFSEEARAAELEAFAQKNAPSGIGSEVRKAAEEIRFRADLKRRVLPEIQQWIATTATRSTRN
ncbi:MAG: aminopeptidase [Chthoniobacterales bacterium]|nr:MAG: aminopeptidase [Chthoniobacterales bacterium]